MLGEFKLSSEAKAQTPLSPETALQRLMDGNRRFAEGRMTSFDEDLEMLKAKTVANQHRSPRCSPARIRACLSS